jgi:hypothetical protein
MAYGSAIHKFLEGYYSCLPIRQCVEMALEFYRPWHEAVPFNKLEFRYNNNLIKTCMAYATEYKRVYGDDEEKDILLNSADFQPRKISEEKNAVEYKFAFLIWQNDFYELYLTGTVDLVASYAGLDLLLVDHKSTGFSFNKVDEFFDGYSLDIQTMLYSMVYKEKLNLDHYPMVLINGIFISKPTVKSEKEGTFDGVQFKRSQPIDYNDGVLNEKMNQFEKWYKRIVEGLIAYLETDITLMYDDYNLAACKEGFQPCAFLDVCKLPRRFHAATLEARYDVKEYNPLKFR